MARKKRRRRRGPGSAAIDVVKLGVTTGVGATVVGAVGAVSPSARIPTTTVQSGLGLVSVAAIPRAAGGVLGSMQELGKMAKKKRR